MEDYFVEMRLSREFACLFDGYLDWCLRNNVQLPKELVDAYNNLRRHYQYEMEKNLS